MIPVVREVGKGFRARCPECGRVTPHRPACDPAGAPQARCTRCGAVHRGQPLGEAPTPDAVPRTMPPPAHRRRVPDAVEQAWHDEIASQGPDAAVPYRPDAPLGVGQLVDHPTFGLGRVRRVLPPATAEVHFQSGFKKLRCAATPAQQQ